ncbi:MAG: Hsp20 family protein [Chitinivibrionales bacterium]|nr:Hsp20 family protein [Chitinivibrionales bacterium]
MYALTAYRPTNALSRRLDDLLGDSGFESSNRAISATNWPKVDIAESENGYKISADLPGLDKKDVTVTVEDGVLTIEGEKQSEHEKKEKGRYYHLERSYGKFSRSFSLPENVDAEKINAKFAHGVLELELTKRPEAKPKAIEVKVD